MENTEYQPYLQKFDFDCGAGIVGWAETNVGNTTSDHQAYMKSVRTSEKEGTDLVALEEYFVDRPEFDARAKSGWTFGQIEAELALGRKCVVAYQNWQKPSDVGKKDFGHYGVIDAIKDDKVYLFDPGSSTGRKEFTKAEFVKRWHEVDLGVFYPRWAMSIDIEGAKARRFAL